MGPEYSVVDTEFFFLFKEKRLEIVQKKIQSLIANLAASSLSSAQVSNSDLRMILDNFLNSGEQTTGGVVLPL